MHASVIKAKQYRDQQKAQKFNNDLKKLSQGLMRAFGVEPAFTPCLNSEGNHRTRRVLSRPIRRERRAAMNALTAIFMGGK